MEIEDFERYCYDWKERVAIMTTEGNQPETFSREEASSQIYREMKADGKSLVEIRGVIQAIASGAAHVQS